MIVTGQFKNDSAPKLYAEETWKLNVFWKIEILSGFQTGSGEVELSIQVSI